MLDRILAIKMSFMTNNQLFCKKGIKGTLHNKMDEKVSLESLKFRKKLKVFECYIKKFEIPNICSTLFH